MDIYQEINCWIEIAQADLHCFPSDEAMENVRKMFRFFADNNQLMYYIPNERKGIMAYCVIPDFTGGTCVSELFMYIKPEHRGSVRLFKELVEHLEQVAKECNCDSVRIASNIGYNDSKVLRCLQHFGYQTDVVIKKMG